MDFKERDAWVSVPVQTLGLLTYFSPFVLNNAYVVQQQIDCSEKRI